MPVLHVRNVPEDLYALLQVRARTQGRSLSSEVILLLEDGLRRPIRSPSAVLEAMSDKRRRRGPLPAGTPPVADLIREDRDR